MNVKLLLQTCSVSNKMIDVNIASYHDIYKLFKVSCSVLNNITCKLPQVPLHRNKIKLPYYIKLADLSLWSPVKNWHFIGFWYLWKMKDKWCNTGGWWTSHSSKYPSWLYPRWTSIFLLQSKQCISLEKFRSSSDSYFTDVSLFKQ